jgi:RNA recognition motif-containing protein
MSNYNSNSSGRRSGRGPRRDSDRNRNGDRDRNRDREPRGNPAPAAPQKKSLWQKIVSLFGGSAKPSESPSKSRPVYTPRNADAATPREPRPERTERPPRDSAPREPREPRKPEAVEVTTPKLYVGNLSFDATEADLSNLFNGVGAVVSAEIVAHKHTEKSKGFGFVTMSGVDEAKRAVDVLHDKDFMGRKLVVSGAKTPVERE